MLDTLTSTAQARTSCVDFTTVWYCVWSFRFFGDQAQLIMFHFRQTTTTRGAHTQTDSKFPASRFHFSLFSKKRHTTLTIRSNICWGSQKKKFFGVRSIPQPSADVSLTFPAATYIASLDTQERGPKNEMWRRRSGATNGEHERENKKNGPATKKNSTLEGWGAFFNFSNHWSFLFGYIFLSLLFLLFFFASLSFPSSSSSSGLRHYRTSIAAAARLDCVSEGFKQTISLLTFSPIYIST